MNEDSEDRRPTVIYVHGAGRQAGEQSLKESFDKALFSAQGRSVVARYSQVFWRTNNESFGGAELALEELVTNVTPPEAAAEEILRLVDTPSGLEAAPDPAAIEEGRQLIAAYFRRADELDAAAQADVQEALPDFIFRRLAAAASADVAAYLYKGWAAEMREPVIETFRRVSDPIVVIAHSLGSIVAYDVLCRSEFSDRDIRLLATAGSPLGIDNVKRRLNDNAGPRPLPASIPLWANFADPEDLVPLFGYVIAGEYDPPPPIHDEPDVDNPAKNNHDLTGYLGLEAFHRDVRKVLGAAAVQA